VSGIIITQEHRDAAADLLLTKGWTQSGHYANDRYGCATDVHGLDAHCFCAIGALARVTGLDVVVVHDYFNEVKVATFNDHAENVEQVVEFLRSGRMAP
jgi:hypothetical protein